MQLIKPKFEQLRKQTLERLKPMREADVAAAQAKIVDLLNHTGDILIERARRPNHTDPLIVINGDWLGPASSHGDIRTALLEHWPGEAFGEMENSYHIEDVEEVVVLRFVATTDERYLTGRVSIRT